jgi:CheY-like chemotaxis protein
MALKELRDEDGEAGAPAPKPKHRILFVEDEDMNWEVGSLHLADKYQLMRAKNSMEVFQALGRHDFHAILMDIQLAKSDLDGIQITQALRGKLAGELPDYARAFKPVELPIIFMTAYAARYTREFLLTVGGDDVLHKPVNFVSLASTLSRMVLRQLTRR